MTFKPIAPNRANETDIRTYLIQRGTDALRNMAGYIPQTTDATVPSTVFSPLPEKLVSHADDMLNGRATKPYPTAIREYHTCYRCGCIWDRILNTICCATSLTIVNWSM